MLKNKIDDDDDDDDIDTEYVSMLASDTANGKSGTKSHIGDIFVSCLIPRMHWHWLQVLPRVSLKEFQNFSIMISRLVLAIHKKKTYIPFLHTLSRASNMFYQWVVDIRQYEVQHDVILSCKVQHLTVTTSDTNYDTFLKMSFQANHKYF